MDTCICGNAISGDWMTHYCSTGEVKELSDKYALEAFIIHKEAEALKLLGKK